MNLSSLVRLMAVAAVFALTSGMAVAAPKAYVGNFGDNTVSVIDTATKKAVATVPVATGPHGMAMTQDGRTVFISGDGSSSVSVIDTATDRVARTVEIGKSPNGIALTPGDKQLLVTVYGEDRVAFLDLASWTVSGSVAVQKPHTVSVTPDGKLAYVTSQDPGHFALVVVDLAKRTVLRSIPLEKTPRDAEFGHDGKAFYFSEAGVSAIQVLDPKTDKVVGEIPTGVSPHFVNFFRGSSAGMITVQGPGEVVLFDPATNKPLRTITVGKQPHWIDISGDGKTAFVPNEGSNDVSVIDIASGETSTIPVGHMPRKVVVQKVAQQAAAESPAAAAESKVSIASFAFGPQTATVAAGTKVTWTNNDGAAHTVTFKDGSEGAKNLSPGQSFSRVFDKPGSFDYFCSYHPFMTARIVVTAK